jgi:hypothetical protein
MSPNTSTLMPRSSGAASASRRTTYVSDDIGRRDQAIQASSNLSSSDDSGATPCTFGFVQ